MQQDLILLYLSNFNIGAIFITHCQKVIILNYEKYIVVKYLESNKLYPNI